MTASALSHRTCPLCDRDNRDEPRLHLSRDEWNLKRCRDCSCVYLENCVSLEALTDEYCWSTSHVKERVRRAADEPVLAAVRRLWRPVHQKLLYRDKCLALCHRFIAPGPVLDIGCGPGVLLGRLDSIYQLHGIEIDPIAFERASHRLADRKPTLLQCDGLTGLQRCPDAFFTGVVMQGYLEHEVLPRDVLAAARRVLRPGGHLVIKVPHYDSWNRRFRGPKWCGLRFPEHVNYFSLPVLRRFLAGAGLSVVRCSWRDRFPLSDSLYLVAQAPLAASCTQSRAA